jgi:hypothetical protein
VTLSKLSLRNAKRQAQDYLVYFITVSLAAALIYAFNGLVASGEIRTLSESMAVLPLIIVLASILVIFIIGWLVHYTMRFMLGRRSRELGTYILLGIEHRQVAGLFFRENLSVGGVAFISGTMLGNLLFQCMRAVILWMFGMPYTFGLAFSPLALGLTLLYFALIYLFALGRSRKRIRKMKVTEMLGYDRQNETESIKKSTARRVMFVASIALGVAGTALMVSGGGAALGIPGAALVIASLYMFFISFSSGVPAFFDKRQGLKYTGTNLLVYRTLAAKLTTMGVTMATIAVLFTATLLSEGSGILFSNLSAFRTETTVNYDLAIVSEHEYADMAYYREYIDANVPVTSEHEYNVYLSGGDQTMRHIESQDAGYYRDFEQDTVLAASDYAALRRMLGYPEVPLGEGGYLIHCLEYLEGRMLEYREPLAIGGQALMPSGVLTEHFSQGYSGINGSQFILVVPDEIAARLEPETMVYAAMTQEPLSREAFAALHAMRNERSSKFFNNGYYDTIDSLANVRRENAAMNAIFVFPLFYLALVLTMVSATILTIQLLSDTNRYRRQYALLNSLGMAREEMRRALRRKFALFYAMPTVPPVAICLIFMGWMGTLFDAGTIVSLWHLWGMIGLTLGIFFAIYLIYIAASFSSFQKSVLPE